MDTKKLTVTTERKIVTEITLTGDDIIELLKRGRARLFAGAETRVYFGNSERENGYEFDITADSPITVTITQRRVSEAK